jgi:hypothetical protein
MATPFGSAAMDLGLGFGGDVLSNQVKDETEEERKKRLQRQQQMQKLSPAAAALGLGSAGMFGGGKMGVGQA